MSGSAGRVIHVVAGLVLVAIGAYVGGTVGWIFGLIGLVPIATGLFDFCLIASLVGGRFDGRENPGAPTRRASRH
ncbi:MAG: DUF2892 domain-containing protein [Actinomycetota bacterium]